MESIKDLDVQSINQIIKTTQMFKKMNTRNDFFKNYIFGLLFFEPSTRTCLSFESAIHRLGGKIIKYHPEYSSEKKGESLQDTIRTIDSYVDVFIITPSLISAPGLTAALAMTQVPIPKELNLLMVDLGCIKLTILILYFLSHSILSLLV